MPGSFTSSNKGKQIRFMDHLDDTYACSEVSIEGQGDLLVKFIDFEASLCTYCEVGLVLVEADKNDLVLFLLHYYNQLRIKDKKELRHAI